MASNFWIPNYSRDLLSWGNSNKLTKPNLKANMTDSKSVSMVLTMLQLQEAVNNKINMNWRSAHNPWYRAIWTECAELADHIEWKWWKKQYPNIPQVHLELIDIWHFGLSDILEKHPEYDSALQYLEPAFEIFAKSSFAAPAPAFNITLANIEEFAEITLATRSFDAQLFAKLAVASGLSLENIYIQYVGKNVLNRFRQDNGYNTGDYIKMWEGREDNEWLVDLAKQFDSALPSYADALYAALLAQYDKVRSKGKTA